MTDSLRDLIDQFKGIKQSYYKKKVNPFCSHGDKCFHCAIIPQLLFIYCSVEVKFHVVFIYDGYYFSGSLRVPRTIDFEVSKLTWNRVCSSYVFSPFETKFKNLQKKLSAKLKLYEKLAPPYNNDLTEEEQLFLSKLIHDLRKITSLNIRNFLTANIIQKLKGLSIDSFNNDLNTEELNNSFQQYSLRRI